MPFGKGRRKLWFVLGALLAGLAALWFACPVWFPVLLRPLGSRVGLRIGTYKRLSYSRLAVRDLVFTNQSLAVHSHQVEILVPTIWLWRLITPQPWAQDYFLRVTNWDCRLLPNNKPSSPPYSQVEDLASVIHLLGKWLPRAVLVEGTVQSGDQVFTIPVATFNRGKLQADVKLPTELSGESVNAQLNQAQPLALIISSPSRQLNSAFELVTNQTGLDVHNLTEWQSNRVVLEAHFGRQDLLPEKASLQTTNFHVPGSFARLPAYGEISGSFSAQWENAQFRLVLTASARPLSTESNLPPVDLTLRAQGSTNAATIQTLEVHSPMLDAQLSDPVTLSFSQPFLQGPAAFRLTADLGQQHWIPASGKVSGQADFSAGPSRLPIVNLRLSGSDVGNDSIKATSATIAAKLDWPTLEVSQTEFRFDDDSRATISGKLDLEKKSATAGQFQFEGPLARRWLPDGYSYSTLSIAGRFEGPLEKPAHSGRISVSGVATPVLYPCSLEVQWNGEAEVLDHFELQLEQTNSAITASGSFKLRPEPIELKLEHLELSTNRVSALALSIPVSFTIALPKAGRGLSVESALFRFGGPAGELASQVSLQWPGRGRVELSLERFPLELLSHFAKPSLPLIHVRHLAASVNWSNTPAILSLEASGTELAQLAGKEGAAEEKPKTPEEAASNPAAQLLATPLNFELRVNGNEHGLVLSNLLVSTATSSVAVAHGFLPLTITPASSNNFINTDGKSELQLNASIRPHAFFWDTVAQLTGVRLGEPTLDLDLSGTWDTPQGKLSFRARDIVFNRTNPPPMKFEDLRLTLSLDREKARLSEGQVLVQGQRVSITADLPLGEGAWKGLLHKKLPDLQKATAHARIENAQLAAFEPLFPELLAPQGNLKLDLQLFPGPKLEGTLILERARTRPLGNTAPLRDINVTLRFHDQTLLLENAAANLSGAEVNLTGKIDWHGTNWLSEGLPPFAIALHGTNVPLAREPEYIIRSDLDLAVTKTNGASPLIFGTAHLRDSFFLSDLAALLPGKVETPSSRPPYFSIDNPTLANWRLAVTVEGVRWLRVRTSLFNGEASANLQVQQGLVTLTSQDPYHPQLLVRANSKQFGYDIHMEATGPVDAPVIQFTSNPPLTSQQILLMITAGQLPPGTFTLTPQQRAQTVALFLGRDLLAKLGLGDQSQERLTFTSGEEISEQGRPTYRVEYKLTDRWSVEGEYDRFGDFNADLKWRIYSK